MVLVINGLDSHVLALHGEVCGGLVCIDQSDRAAGDFPVVEAEAFALRSHKHDLFAGLHLNAGILAVGGGIRIFQINKVQLLGYCSDLDIKVAHLEGQVRVAALILAQVDIGAVPVIKLLIIRQIRGKSDLRSCDCSVRRCIAAFHGNVMIIVVHSRQGNVALGHGERELRVRLLVIFQIPALGTLDFPVIELLLIRIVLGLDLNGLLAQSGHTVGAVHGATDNGDRALLLVGRSDGHVSAGGHYEALVVGLGQVELTYNVSVVHDPAGEVPAVAACSLDVVGIASLCLGLRLTVRIDDDDVVTLRGHRGQLDVLLFRYHEVKLRVFLMTIQRDVALPVAELAVFGEIGLDMNGVAHSSSADGLAVHGDGVQGLVVSGQSDIALRHRNVDGFIHQLSGSVRVGHFPVIEPLAFQLVGGEGVGLSAQGVGLNGLAKAIVDGDGAVPHLHCFQGHIAHRHIELEGGV